MKHISRGKTITSDAHAQAIIAAATRRRLWECVDLSEAFNRSARVAPASSPQTPVVPPPLGMNETIYFFSPLPVKERISAGAPARQTREPQTPSLALLISATTPGSSALCGEKPRHRRGNAGGPDNASRLYRSLLGRSSEEGDGGRGRWGVWGLGGEGDTWE